jgi:hypothetical protein
MYKKIIFSLLIGFSFIACGGGSTDGTSQNNLTSDKDTQDSIQTLKNSDAIKLPNISNETMPTDKINID